VPNAELDIHSEVDIFQLRKVIENLKGGDEDITLKDFDQYFAEFVQENKIAG